MSMRFVRFVWITSRSKRRSVGIARGPADVSSAGPFYGGSVIEEQDEQSNIELIGESLIPSTIEVIGADEKGVIYLWDNEKCRQHIVDSLNKLDESKLTFIRGRAAFLDIARRMDDDKSPAAMIRNAIADIARNRPISAADSLGQGVWKNPAGKGLLLLSGTQAFIIDGSTVNPILRPIVGRTLLDFTGSPWIDFQSLTSIMISHQEQGGVAHRQVYQEVVDLLAPWNFEKETDRVVVASMIFAAAVAGALEFRPNVWVTGHSTTGKTALKVVLQRLWPHAFCFEGETSEAARRGRTLLIAPHFIESTGSTGIRTTRTVGPQY